MKRILVCKISILILCIHSLYAQDLRNYKDSTVISNPQVKVVVDNIKGRISYRFASGAYAENTVAYINDVNLGYFASSDFSTHTVTSANISDSLGTGLKIDIKHTDDKLKLSLTQHITIYKDQSYLVISVDAAGADKSVMPETRDISPLAILPKQQGKLYIPGSEPRILDVPFDNDNWVPDLERKWSATGTAPVEGISYELSSIYDNNTFAGIVTGSLKHDFWKTGIVYRTGSATGVVDSLKIFGGAATEDNKSKKPAYGGLDGTHDHAPHGTMTGETVSSPLIYLSGTNDIRKVFVDYGNANAKLNGRLQWKGYAPVYWNSFGVEGVLGYEKVMMPPGVLKITDFIRTLDNFNKYAKPVLSIDSYDQDIYTTELLASLGRYAKKNNQQMGFYFIPFAMWTWKNSIDDKEMPGSHYQLREVVLRDKNGQPIMYKEGDFCAYALDPTHPGVRLYVINQLEKAKAINAKFIKIDFLSAGSLESTVRYDSKVRSGMHAYSDGMKMLKALADSIMGKDIFITQAISPMFPNQYAHTRFVSTDVYSHLRDDEKGFPSWGSTESSMATGSHMWWVQGTLWPYTNLDVAIMKNFQKNPDLSEQEIKVRMYAMMTMGSILGDGSDFRNKIAADRAKIYLNNKNICEFFSDPKVFTPLKFADGESFDQQLAFYLKGDTTLVSVFNFDKVKPMQQEIFLKDLGLANGHYVLKDFLTDAVIGEIEAGKASFTLKVEHEDAALVKIVAAK
ncbi:hypothetical protein KXD93_08245 [Mucilaginibacter sp. BJC16-A38]|uniref:hypothetical protein n=1 Tax=Mucilaginibacter phenanthrenivorans TaxID=1234842 RepID=UPI0021570708|nr:hypothetical protein [Mucilaginibacter phenanthrenivorans]MCR8557629.1 hypothetical protein [Mucilaginibacter phenanthrenivorans]